MTFLPSLTPFGLRKKDLKMKNKQMPSNDTRSLGHIELTQISQIVKNLQTSGFKMRIWF